MSFLRFRKFISNIESCLLEFQIDFSRNQAFTNQNLLHTNFIKKNLEIIIKGIISLN